MGSAELRTSRKAVRVAQDLGKRIAVDEGRSNSCTGSCICNERLIQTEKSELLKHCSFNRFAVNRYGRKNGRKDDTKQRWSEERMCT